MGCTWYSTADENKQYKLKRFWCFHAGLILTQPMDPEIKSLNFIFPTKHVIPESLKFSHWLSEDYIKALF